MASVAKVIKKHFPEYQLSESETEMEDLFVNEFLVHKNQILALESKAEERERVKQIHDGLNQIEQALFSLHPQTKRALEKQQELNMLTLHKVAPGVALTFNGNSRVFSKNFSTIIRSLKHTVTGAPKHQLGATMQLPKLNSALDAALKEIDQMSEKKGAQKRHKTLEKKQVVSKAIDMWERYSGFEPQVWSEVFLNFLEDVISLIDPKNENGWTDNSYELVRSFKSFETNSQ